MCESISGSPVTMQHHDEGPFLLACIVVVGIRVHQCSRPGTTHGSGARSWGRNEKAPPLDAQQSVHPMR